MEPLGIEFCEAEVEDREGLQAPIAIVGGGVAGLSFACILEKNKIPYVVFEREAEPPHREENSRAAGATNKQDAAAAAAATGVEARTGSTDDGSNVDRGTPVPEDRTEIITEFQGTKALFAMGRDLFNDFKKLAAQIEPDSIIRSFYGSEEQCHTATGFPYYLGLIREFAGREVDKFMIDCVQLRGLFLDRIPKEKVRWGKEVMSVDREQIFEEGRKYESDEVRDTEKGEKETRGAQTQGWQLRFSDGTSESGFLLIVGADGAQSRVRPLASYSSQTMAAFFLGLFVNT
ncbi:hypothetical protein F5Y17DRAFT_232865 [Xylariaceae sp. FL0594]|nr:hypothetical protein F5Y17DRAFT_232865 [Xylariaceae sp. FL0594]